MKRGRRNRPAKAKRAAKTIKAGKGETKVILDIAARYLLLICLALNNLWVFYFIFTPLTMFISAFLLSLLFDAIVYKEAISVNGYIISMVGACIGGSAYYFLAILNLTTKGIEPIKRIKVFLFSATLFLALNIARIVLLAMMQAKDMGLFDITHKVFWYGISTIYIVFIWLLTIKVFRIKSIPFYSDFLFLKSQIPGKKRKHKSRAKSKARTKVKKRTKRRKSRKG